MSVVVAVHANAGHTFSKESRAAITLHEGLGVVGDAHYGATVKQINNFQPGLLKQVVRKGAGGKVERLAGVMGVVSRSGEARPGDAVRTELPPGPHFPLTRV